MDSLKLLDFSSFIIFSDDPWSLLVSFCQLFKLPLVVQYCDVICEWPLRELGGGGHVAAAAGWNIEINYRYGLRGHWWKLCWLKANFYGTLYLSSIIIPQFHRRFRRDEDTMYPYYFIIWHTVNSLNTRLKIYICPIVRKCRKGEVDILKYLHLMAETQSPGAGTLAWWWIPTATTSRADAVLTRRKYANTADPCQEVNSHYALPTRRSQSVNFS